MFKIYASLTASANIPIREQVISGPKQNKVHQMPGESSFEWTSVKHYAYVQGSKAFGIKSTFLDSEAMQPSFNYRTWEHIVSDYLQTKYYDTLSTIYGQWIANDNDARKELASTGMSVIQTGDPRMDKLLTHKRNIVTHSSWDEESGLPIDRTEAASVLEQLVKDFVANPKIPPEPYSVLLEKYPSIKPKENFIADPIIDDPTTMVEQLRDRYWPKLNEEYINRLGDVLMFEINKRNSALKNQDPEIDLRLMDSAKKNPRYHQMSRELVKMYRQKKLPPSIQIAGDQVEGVTIEDYTGWITERRANGNETFINLDNTLTPSNVDDESARAIDARLDSISTGIEIVPKMENPESPRQIIKVNHSSPFWPSRDLIQQTFNKLSTEFNFIEETKGGGGDVLSTLIKGVKDNVFKQFDIATNYKFQDPCMAYIYRHWERISPKNMKKYPEGNDFWSSKPTMTYGEFKPTMKISHRELGFDDGSVLQSDFLAWYIMRKAIMFSTTINRFPSVSPGVVLQWVYNRLIQSKTEIDNVHQSIYQLVSKYTRFPELVVNAIILPIRKLFPSLRFREQELVVYILKSYDHLNQRPDIKKLNSSDNQREILIKASDNNEKSKNISQDRLNFFLFQLK